MQSTARGGRFLNLRNATSLSATFVPTSMRRALLCLVAALLGLRAAPAQAQTEIGWNDFSATQQVCTTGCTQSEWMQVLNCDLYDCWYDLELVCVAYGTSCQLERIPLPDGDIIDYTIEHGAVSPEVVEWRLVAAPNVGWWKQVRNRGGPDVWKVWTDNGKSWCSWPQAATADCNQISEWTGVLLSGAQEFVFSKAKFLASHQDVYVLRNLSSHLRGGDRITFTWRKD